MNKRFGDDPFEEFDKLIRAAAGAEPPPPLKTEEQPASPAQTVATHPRPVACPYLGIIEDPTSRFMQVDAAHRCFATRKATTIEEEHQASYCLVAKHRSCDVFVALQRQGGQVEEEPASWLGRMWRGLWRRRRP